MMTVPWARHARLAALLVVAALFLMAGASKLGDPARFAVEIGHYRLVPPPVGGLLAVYLPWLEIALGFGLCAPGWRAEARVLAIGLLAVFCAALVGALVRGLDIRCGCFGGAAGGGMSAAWALARNGALIALLAAAGPWRGGHAGRVAVNRPEDLADRRD